MILQKVIPKGLCRLKGWLKNCLQCEELPASFLKDKKLTVKLVPSCYIFNLVGYVLNYLDEMDTVLTNPIFIPSEVFSKIGGDRGQGSFKMSFQITNTNNPNKPENTVLFNVMEAKDMKSNLILGLQRFKAQVDQFSKVKWNLRAFFLW